MARTEVYSWRLSAALKSALEEVARGRGISVSALIEEATREWLGEHAAELLDHDAGQERVRARAMRVVGSIRSIESTSRTKRAEPGGSSSVLSRAFWACSFMRSASRTRNTLMRPRFGLSAIRLTMNSRTTSTLMINAFRARTFASKCNTRLRCARKISN